MKKAILIALGVIAVCSVFLAGTVIAAKEGYGFQISQGEEITVDGAVSPATEWDDSYKDFLYDGWTMTTNFFRDKWGMDPAISEGWLLEILTDTTDDAGDNFKFTCDTLVDGGAAPQADDFKIEYTGGTTTIYAGTGTAWGTSAAVLGEDVIIATSIAASPASATPHRIIEVWIMKQGVLAQGLSNNAMLSYTDAGAGKTFMWPPESSVDSPDTYGMGETLLGADPIPEGLTVGVMLSLSAVAVLVSTRYFRKPPRI